MGEIPKPDLTNLMNLFIGWGLAILKKKWLDRADYPLQVLGLSRLLPKISSPSPLAERYERYNF